MYKRTRVAGLMDLSKITSVLCNVQDDKSSWSHGLVKDNKCALICIAQEDKSSLSHGIAKDDKCALQCTRGQE